MVDKNLLNNYIENLFNLPMFDGLKHKPLVGVLEALFDNLYNVTPKEVDNFFNGDITVDDNFIDIFFKNMGIDDDLMMKIPTSIKPKLVYCIYELFENKGSSRIFELFADLIEDYYPAINFYNIKIHETESSIVPEKLIYIKRVLKEDGTDITDSALEFINVTSSINYHLNIIRYSINMTSTYTYNLILEFNTSHVVQTDNGTYITKNVQRTILASETEKIFTETKTWQELTRYAPRTLEYKLEPIYIMNHDDIMTNVIEEELQTNKYMMQLEQYVSRVNRGYGKKNVFPITTNVVYIQQTVPEDIDGLKDYNIDLIRLYTMSKYYSKVITIRVGGVSADIPLNDYLRVLQYIKLLEVCNVNDVSDIEAESIMTLDGNHINYSNFSVPQKIDDIFESEEDYQQFNKPISQNERYDLFWSFNSKLSKLLSTKQSTRNRILKNKAEIEDYLTGDNESTIEGYYSLLGKLNVSFEDIEYIKGITSAYNITSPDDLHSKLMEYKPKLYNNIEEDITRKYPRLIHAINEESLKFIDNKMIYTEMFLSLYQDVAGSFFGSDYRSKIFFDVLFKRLFTGSAFKNYFYDPIIELFRKYFFNVDMSYYNIDQKVVRIDGIGNMIPCKTTQSLEVGFQVTTDDLTPKDDVVVTVEYKFPQMTTNCIWTKHSEHDDIYLAAYNGYTLIVDHGKLDVDTNILLLTNSQMTITSSYFDTNDLHFSDFNIDSLSTFNIIHEDMVYNQTIFI